MHWFFFAITSAVLSSVAAITQKKSLVSINALEFSFHLSWINLILCIPFLISADIGSVTSHQLLIMFIKTILQSLAFWCVMLSLKSLEISSALPLLALTPGLVAISAFIFIGEALTLKESIGLTMLLLGSYFIEMKDLKNAIEPFKVFFRTKKYIFVASALLFFTFSTILDKYLLKDQKMETSSFMIFQHLFFLIIFVIFMIFTRTKFTLPKGENLKPLMILILVTAFMTIGYRYTQIVAFTLAPVALVVAIKRISVFFASIAGGKIFKEGGLVKKGIAAFIIVMGTILMIFKN
jgi:drug/metabolite transporter (DMT)-like permease